MLIQFIGTLPKPTEIPLQEIPRKLTDLDTDIYMDFEENSCYQEGVISETCQRPEHIPGTTRIGKSSEYSQASAKVFTKTS